MRTVAVLSTKGGVAKTTTVVNLAAAMEREGHRVLVLDLDMQGSASEYLLQNQRFEHTTADWIDGTVPALTCIYPARESGSSYVHVMPADVSVGSLENTLRGSRQWNVQQLASIKGEIADQYDYLLIDCARSLGPLEINAVIAADLVICPISMQPAAAVGVRNVRKMYDDWSRIFELPPLLILPTMLDGRIQASQRMLKDLQQHYGMYADGPVLPPIRYAAAFVNSYYESKSVFELEGASAERAVEDIMAVYHIINNFSYGSESQEGYSDTRRHALVDV